MPPDPDVPGAAERQPTPDGRPLDDGAASALWRADVPEGDRWIVVDGRRWRATDPGLAEPARTHLVEELMSARRAVGAATRAHDPVAERAARNRVQDAKVALGERGAAWWESPEPAAALDRVRSTVRALVRHRAPDRTICPSDVARALGAQRWRQLMEPTREVVRELAQAGEVRVTQRGAPLDPGDTWRGPIRIGTPPSERDAG